MRYSRRKLRAGLAAFVAFSLFVCVATGGASARAPGRQIDFTPNIPALEMTQTAQALNLRIDITPTAVPEGARIPISDSAWFVQGLTSEEALALCSEQWGTREVGICVAPGGYTYYVWTEPGTVMEVVLDSTQVWQQHFIDAAERIAGDLESLDTEHEDRDLARGIAFVSGLATIAGCGTLIACVAAGGAFLASLRELTITEGHIDGLFITVCEDTRDAVFNYCMMQGLGEAACRETAGYDEPCALPCPPRAVCPTD